LSFGRKGKIFAPAGKQNQDRSTHSLVAIATTVHFEVYFILFMFYLRTLVGDETCSNSVE